eukprot:Pompholyxophrys_sp_v1_NODE_29_length_3693_cov_2.397746.p3 type:complete len:153 gc:universal NODE_29_length_3693_cov_2.397746:712-254(-)
MIVSCNLIVKLKEIGKAKYQEFVQSVLLKRTSSINDPIKQNKLFLFSSPPLKTLSKTAKEILALKNNVHLFNRLYVSALNRGGDIQQFFAHENQHSRPSLSVDVQLRIGTKSDLMECVDAFQTYVGQKFPLNLILLCLMVLCFFIFSIIQLQ